MNGFRTDLAAEELPQGGGQLPGVTSRSFDEHGFSVTEVRVLDEAGANALHKPVGRYVTMDVESFFRREEDSFSRAVSVLSEQIRLLTPLGEDESVLVAALGNPDITPDAVGPQTSSYVLATRHLRGLPGADFSFLRPVSVFRTGVLGTTGIESAALVRMLAESISPALVVVIDALATRSSDNLCRTVQLSDSGIVPGSGVGNDRAELSVRVLGIPVIAIGVPTVVDAGDGLIITPREIDRYVKDAGKLIAYALNLAFHPRLTISDLDMFVG